MGNAQARNAQEEYKTEKALWMLEGSHGVERDAETAVALLVVNAEDGDAEAMWMLGVCCEFGIGMEQDVARAEQLYERGAKRNATAKLLIGKLKNKNGRGCTEMDLEGEQRKNKQTSYLESPLVVDRSTLRCRGSKGTGFDAADERAARCVGPKL